MINLSRKQGKTFMIRLLTNYVINERLVLIIIYWPLWLKILVATKINCITEMKWENPTGI